MRYLFTLAAAVLFASSATAADTDAERFEWTQDKFDFVATGDLDEGKKLAKKHRCRRCHNENGISDDEEIPSIAGQRATYMYKQLSEFKQGHRVSKDMKKATRKLSQQDMVHISAWYSSLDRPPKAGNDQMLVFKVCDSCHEKEVVEKDNRIEVAPVIAGQVRQYLETNMFAFKQAERSNDLYRRMQSVSHKLTDAEIRRVARYYGAGELQE